MALSTPIPNSACFKDPFWVPHFLELANTLVMFGAKPKLITRYTGLPPKAIVERYNRLRGEKPPHGRMSQSSAKTYANPSNRGSLPWMLQCAAFANIYSKLLAATRSGGPINDGWLLAKAFESYRRLTENPVLQSETRAQRLNLTNGYDIAFYIKGQTLGLVNCDECGAAHLILVDVEADGQNCPMCAIQRRYAMLIDNSAAITAARLTTAG